jgi:hypothetical protein
MANAGRFDDEEHIHLTAGGFLRPPAVQVEIHLDVKKEKI